MASELLPPAIAAKGFIDVSIPISAGSGTAAAGYPTVIAPVSTNLISAIEPLAAIAGGNNTLAILFSYI